MPVAATLDEDVVRADAGNRYLLQPKGGFVVSVHPGGAHLRVVSCAGESTQEYGNEMRPLGRRIPGPR